MIQELVESKKETGTSSLSRSDTLKFIQIVEEQKIAVSLAMQKRCQAERITNPIQIQLLMQNEKTKTFDKLRIEHGVSEDDLQNGVKEHKLNDDPEFKALLMQIQAKARQLQ